MSHPVLTQIPQKWLVWEITSSMQYLKKVNGDKIFLPTPMDIKDQLMERLKNCSEKMELNTHFLPDQKL